MACRIYGKKAYGLDSNKADDALYTLDPQFTNLEVYLNSILTEHWKSYREPHYSYPITFSPELLNPATFPFSLEFCWFGLVEALSISWIWCLHHWIWKEMQWLCEQNFYSFYSVYNCHYCYNLCSNGSRGKRPCGSWPVWKSPRTVQRDSSKGSGKSGGHHRAGIQLFLGQEIFGSKRTIWAGTHHWSQ